MKNPSKFLVSTALLLGLSAAAQAQNANPQYGPGPVPCGGVACVAQSLTTSLGGTAAAPAVAILNANTGLYSTSTGANLGLSVGGVLHLDYAITTGNTVTTPNNFTSGGAIVAATGIQLGATNTLNWNGRTALTSPADGQVKATNNSASTTLFDYGVTTTGFTINGTLSATLAAATAIDTVCYSTVSKLFTEEPTGTTCTVSARRFKRDIKYLSSAAMLIKVLGMKPVSFRFKKGVGQDDGAEVHYGLIAEDVEKAAPELVAYEKDGQTHGVKYGDGELTSHLIGAIKAEQGEIDLLKHEIAQLERRK